MQFSNPYFLCPTFFFFSFDADLPGFATLGLLIGSSFVFKKKGLINCTKNGMLAGEGHAYLKSTMWWSGMLMSKSKNEVLNTKKGTRTERNQGNWRLDPQVKLLLMAMNSSRSGGGRGFQLCRVRVRAADPSNTLGSSQCRDLVRKKTCTMTSF